MDNSLPTFQFFAMSVVCPLHTYIPFKDLSLAVYCAFQLILSCWGVYDIQASFGKPSAQESAAAPNNILFIQNLPHETTSMMLQVLFQQYPGFREVRMIEAKPGIAFVEFEDDVQSSVAMQALQGFKITPQNPMAITYAKK